ncbi:hypothetical protein CO611_09400 [Lysobacteraceae bacterium NML03-0222]|nr:hypothetical protein CO611_09400 [Xanthomonadaceae bacterium NML03-0222]
MLLTFLLSSCSSTGKNYRSHDQADTDICSYTDEKQIIRNLNIQETDPQNIWLEVGNTIHIDTPRYLHPYSAITISGKCAYKAIISTGGQIELPPGLLFTTKKEPTTEGKLYLEYDRQYLYNQKEFQFLYKNENEFIMYTHSGYASPQPQEDFYIGLWHNNNGSSIQIFKASNDNRVTESAFEIISSPLRIDSITYLPDVHYGGSLWLSYPRGKDKVILQLNMADVKDIINSSYPVFKSNP